MKILPKIFTYLLPFAGVLMLGAMTGCASGGASGTTNAGTGIKTTTTALSASSTSVTYGTQVSLIATVTAVDTTGTAPQGTVTFYDGTTIIASGQLDYFSLAGYKAAFAVGTHTFTAQYAGDSTHSPSTSTAVTVTVTNVPITPGASGLTAANIYVVQESSTGSAILGYASSSNGTVTASTTLVAPSGTTFNSVATDAAGNLYVGALVTATNVPEVLVYGAGSSGTATPVRTISGANTVLSTTINSLAVDATGTIYVSCYYPTEILAYAPGSNGNVAPSRTIAGTATGLASGLALTVDSSNNLYVASNSSTGSTSSILEFSPAATGNVAPFNTISGGSTQVDGVALDTKGNIYATVYSGVGSSGFPVIEEFAPAASGNATPTRTLQGQSGITGYGGLQVDSAGNIYVEATLTGTDSAIAIYTTAASGSTPPAATITSGAWNSPGVSLAIH